MTFVGCLFASFQLDSAQNSILKVFAREIVSLWIIGGISLTLFYIIFFKWVEIPYSKLAARITGVVILVNVPVLQVQHWVAHLASNRQVEIMSMHNGLIILRGLALLIIVGLVAIKLEQLEFISKQQYPQERIDTKTMQSPPEMDQPDSVSVQIQGEKATIQIEDILYIQGDSYQSLIHSGEKIFSAGKTLKFLESYLDGSGFQRIHKSYIVKLNTISHIKYYMGGRYLAYLKDSDKALPVGRTYAQGLKKSLGIS